MSYYKDQIDAFVHELEQSLKKYTSEYETITCKAEGKLIRCINNGKPRYYQAQHEGERYIRKSVEKDPDLLGALARKAYLERLTGTIRQNLATLKNAGNRLQADDFDALKASMQKAYRELPDEYFFQAGSPEVSGSDDFKERMERHRAWAKEQYKQSDFMPEARKHMTSAGFRVRSKSEQAIVEQLMNFAVPFRYEQVIMISGKDYSADFTFQDANMELFYWEHAGMMDLLSYVDRYHKKMAAYDSIGIVPWKNLIITYDMDGAINVPMVKAIIENEVIPRL